MHTYRDEDLVRSIDADSPSPLIRWSAVLAGLVLGLALLALLSALWFALAYASGVAGIEQNLEWFIGASAVVALFMAAILTGYLSGVRGVGTGMLHGLTLWGALLVLALTVGIPSLVNVFDFGTISAQAADVAQGGSDLALWASFWTILGGSIAAGLGGALGGSMSRGMRTRTRTIVLDEEPSATEPSIAHDAHDDGRRTTTSVLDEDSDGHDDHDEDHDDDDRADAERRTYRVS